MGEGAAMMLWLNVSFSIFWFILAIWQGFRLQFYQGYFNQKQINAGRDPHQVLREEFGRWYWLMR